MTVRRNLSSGAVNASDGLAPHKRGRSVPTLDRNWPVAGSMLGENPLLRLTRCTYQD